MPFFKLIMFILGEKRTLKTKIKVVLVHCHFIYYTAIAIGTKLVIILSIALLSFYICFLIYMTTWFSKTVPNKMVNFGF